MYSVQPNNKRREVPQWQSRPQPFFPLQWTCSFAAAPLHWTCHAADAQIPRLIERSCLGFQDWALSHPSAAMLTQRKSLLATPPDRLSQNWLGPTECSSTSNSPKHDSRPPEKVRVKGFQTWVQSTWRVRQWSNPLNASHKRGRNCHVNSLRYPPVGRNSVQSEEIGL